MRFTTIDKLIVNLLWLHALLIHHADAANSQPLSVTFGPDFIGYDGKWSPVQVRVGTPEQYVQVFPSTISSETWVAGSKLCTGSTCASLRGGLFYSENSTTWQSLGAYELGYSELSQTTENGDYGFDTLALSDSVAAPTQVIAVVDDNDHWNGHLGLSVEETRFNNETNHLSLISTLVQNSSVIPSHSYGYTAGASYLGAGILGSLTLGGVDTSRFTASDFWFTLASGYKPSVYIQSLTVAATGNPTNWEANPLTLMSQSGAASFVIDTSTPFLWLPQTICDDIATALNLTWDPSIELYIFSNDSSPQSLVPWALEFMFTLADSATTSQTLTLKIPYVAFNLQLSYPFPELYSGYNDSTVSYFPLRRANNTQQYTIGRTFLQETYLIVDYERNACSLSQALFPDSSQQPQLAAIERPKHSTWPGPAGSTSSSLSTGAKAGLAIGLVVAFVVVAALVGFCCVRRRKDRDSFDEKSQRKGLLSIFSKRSTVKSSTSGSVAELNADKRHPTELISDSTNSRFELSSTTPAEMAAGEVPPNFFQERVNTRIPQRNDPRSPVELVQPQSRSSINKTGADEQVTERSSSPAPAYSPVEINQRHSQSISPNSPRATRNPFRNGSDNGVSPVTGTNSDRGQISNPSHGRSGSGSSGLLSPVSPLPGRGGSASILPASSKRGSSVRQAVGSNDTSSRGSLSPTSAAAWVPRRTPSRDSRFREELAETAPIQNSYRTQEPVSDQVTEQARSQGSKTRFSWE